MSAPQPPAAVMPPAQPSTSPTEKSALGRVQWFAILQVVGLAAGWVAGIYLYSQVFANIANLNLQPNPTPAQVASALGPLFQSIVYIVPISALIGLFGMVLLTSGFRGLSKVDSRFSVPSIFMIILVVGFVLVIAGVVPFVSNIPALIAQVPTTPGNQPSAALTALITSLLGYLALIFLGGILALIGLIGGMILGLWRVGSKYDETVVKLGAIFVIIPLLNIVAPILILAGVHTIRGRLGAQ